MPAYVVSARNPQGELVDELREAASGERVVELLEREGYSDIRLRTSETSAALREGEGLMSTKGLETIEAELRVELETGEPEDFQGRVRQVALRRSGPWILLYLMAVAWYWTGYPGHPWANALLLIPLVLYVLVLFWPDSTGIYREFVRSVAWRDWDRAERLLRKIERGIGLNRTRLPPFEVSVRRAQILAGRGRLDEALAEIRSHHGLVPEWTYWARLSGVYTIVHDLDEARACTRRAHESAPELTILAIDLAAALVRSGDLEEARALLDASRGRILSEIERSGIAAVEGALAVREGQFEEGVDRLEEARTVLAEFRPRPLPEELDLHLQAELAVALAGCDRWAEAREHAAAALPLAEAQGLSGHRPRLREIHGSSVQHGGLARHDGVESR